VIREAFRTHKGLFAGLELIVQPRPEAMALSNEELREEFLKVGARLARLD
jgi:ribonuclease P protein component